MAKGKFLTNDAFERTKNAVLRIEHSPYNQLPPLKREYRPGGGSCTCKEIHSFITTGATSGTVTATWTISATNYAVSWAYDADDSALQSALDAVFGSGNTIAHGGPWPAVELQVEFAGDFANTSIDWPTVNNSSLGGGKCIMWKFSSAE